MIETINYLGTDYPKFQASGFAARFAFPFAAEVCKGTGFDIGCAKREWAFPGAIPIDIVFGEEWHAHNLPSDPMDVNYIFSSHCLEHLDDWVGALNHWTLHLKQNGTMFLYLPAYDQTYWRPWNNRKHKNIFTPEIISDYLRQKGYCDIFASGKDLNSSFMVMATKGW